MLGFGVPIAFGVWQLLDLRRERRLDEAKRRAAEQQPTAEPDA